MKLELSLEFDGLKPSEWSVLQCLVGVNSKQPFTLFFQYMGFLVVGFGVESFQLVNNSPKLAAHD
jgi:hypothetical protein